MNTNFERVTNNQEKFITYKAQMERFKLARDQGFLFEAIFILYAVMEDRLSSFLFHAGVSNCNRDKITTNKKVRPQLDEIFTHEDKNLFTVRKISNKIDLIQSLLTWAGTYGFDDSSTDFKDILAKQVNQTPKAAEMISILGEIQNWCRSRNELVHALLNRKVENQEARLQLLTDDGYTYCRKLNNFVRSFKKGNTIRKQFNIQ